MATQFLLHKDLDLYFCFQSVTLEFEEGRNDIAMYHPRLQQSATRMRYVASSKLYFIIVIGFLVVHIATSLKFGGYGRLSRCKCSSAHSEWQSRLSAVTQGGQFSLDWYVESNLISKKVMAIDESSARVVNPTFISTTSALQSYTGNN